MEKERAEHKRLLSEAQELANDLQEQLRVSEMKRSNEKRDLIVRHSQRQLDWESEREDLEIRVTEVGLGLGRRVTQAYRHVMKETLGHRHRLVLLCSLIREEDSRHSGPEFWPPKVSYIYL
jgi:hypothetical protein